MGNSRIKGKDLRKLNYKSDRSKSLAIDIMSRNFKHQSKTEKLKILEDVLQKPEDFLTHEVLFALAEEIVGKVPAKKGFEYRLKEEGQAFHVFGKKHIDSNTMYQMETAMRLPVSVSGALMPDAHVGYGLPIGGVLATENSVVPYAVGLDIACGMSLSIYDMPIDFLKRNAYQIKTTLKEKTHFGIGSLDKPIANHEVMERAEFSEIKLLKKLHGKAWRQLGTSGSGNHFVEFGVVELKVDNRLKLPKGQYIGILAHSGSRGLGSEIASYYTQVAKELCLLPKQVQQLAWLDMNTEAGQEYWACMNLAGDYAKASHDVIHQQLAKALGLKQLAKLENHHNFAWKEQVNGQEMIVHRKGATPAHKGQLGMIPASMLDVGYIVSGLGNERALNSASHGSGRKMSRKKAKDSITGSELRKRLKSSGVNLIGGSVEEAPMVYKNLEEVMKSQVDLVEEEGKFYPRIVRMDKG